MGAAVIVIRAMPTTAMGKGNVTVARTSVEVTATTMRTVTAAEEPRTKAVVTRARRSYASDLAFTASEGNGGTKNRRKPPLARVKKRSVRTSMFPNHPGLFLRWVLPAMFSAVSGPKNRVNNVFVDYLRNGKAQSTVAAFSARARPGLAVSMPISWADLPDVHGSDQWNIRTALDRTSPLRKDPWSGYWDRRQLITPEMRRRLVNAGDGQD
jgi:hypothetical protein